MPGRELWTFVFPSTHSDHRALKFFLAFISEPEPQPSYRLAALITTGRRKNDFTKVDNIIMHTEAKAKKMKFCHRWCHNCATIFLIAQAGRRTWYLLVLICFSFYAVPLDHLASAPPNSATFLARSDLFSCPPKLIFSTTGFNLHRLTLDSTRFERYDWKLASSFSPSAIAPEVLLPPDTKAHRGYVATTGHQYNF